MPPLSPAQMGAPDPDVLEVCDVLPNGMLSSGSYVRLNGEFYDTYLKGNEVWVRYRASGPVPPGWLVNQGSWNERSGKTTFRRMVPAEEIEQYVRVLTTGWWRGFEFGLVVYREDGLVAIQGEGHELADLIEAGVAPGLETFDRGRSVTGLVRWDELTDVKQLVEDLPLPVSR
ncbi:hypothetical protein ACX80E_07500 [Arthrobacter sp. TMN-49]